MFGRNKTSKKGANLPQDWAESLARLLNETYKTVCKQKGRYFDVYGQIYPEELLVIVSYLSEKGESITPITLFLSSKPDDVKSAPKVKATQDNFIDIIGLMFDEIFSTDDWDDFEPDWQEITHKKETYYYKVSRENINLTLEADKLLGPDFEDIEEDLDH